MTGEISNKPLHPGWLIPMTLIAGPAASGPVAGAALHRFGHRKQGWALGILSCLAGPIAIFTAVLWKTEWYWAAIALTGFHFVFGMCFLFILLKPYKQFRATLPVSGAKKGCARDVFVGMLGGVFFGGMLGMASSVLYVILLDRLFSTLMPVAFEDQAVLIKVLLGVFLLTLAGAAAGGFFGRLKPRITPVRIILYGLILVWAHHTWLLALECTVSVPIFQAGAATSQGWEGAMKPLLIFDLLIGTWWPVFLLFYIISPSGKFGKLGRAVQTVGINLAAGVTLSVTFGFTADAFLGLGHHFERSALPSKALWCYEQGLKKKPDDRISSYLQYRSALLNHKLGDREKAKRGFRRVVAKYTSNKALVKKSSRFLDSLERADGLKRVVLPGVETPTEYKGGYCVPNSLALAMRYWGSDVTAWDIGKRITGLGSGTFIVDQTWFAVREGFRHDFLPLAGPEDIVKCIDAGFPVLVYVPRHAFAIVGYDDALETFVTYDIATRDVWVEYIRKDFIKSWKKQATTMVLVYPPEKQEMIPAGIRERLARLSDDYFHFQLYDFDAPTNAVSIPHLFRAAGESGEFFPPIAVLYSKFPGLRKMITEKYDARVVIQSMTRHFRNNFDEGVHEAGQYHNENTARSDRTLRRSVNYLISLKRFELMEELMKHINEEGPLSDSMLSEIGMIDLANGEFTRGQDRLRQADTIERSSFYSGLVNLNTGNGREAVRELLKTVQNEIYQCSPEYDEGDNFFYDSKDRLYLDKYGFPQMAVANRVLANTDDFGESRETLEKEWEIWLHHVPFDFAVAGVLARLYEERLAKLDREKDAAAYQRLNRKLKLVKIREARYGRQTSGF